MTTIVRRLVCALAASLLPAAAFAQLAHRPFAVGGGEGGGGASGGLTGWLLAEQSQLTHVMVAHVKALHGDPTALWALVGLGFAYGVFHAAGPGHGKAVIASYMMANERSLRRGVVMALLAALLQAAIAITLVGAAAVVFNATAASMNAAADWLSVASAAGVAGMGLWLTWRKGRALAAALGRRFERRQALSSSPAFAGIAWRMAPRTLSAAAYRAAAPGARDADLCCGPDAAAVANARSLRDAAATVIAAGSRQCSGALLVLVFALSQRVFAAGVAAAVAMALGVAATTGALAAAAVFAKSLATRFAGAEESRAALVARAFEFAASLAVFAFGLLLMFAAGRGA